MASELVKWYNPLLLVCCGTSLPPVEMSDIGLLLTGGVCPAGCVRCVPGERQDCPSMLRAVVQEAVRGWCAPNGEAE